jgi:hypothetical protein
MKIKFDTVLVDIAGDKIVSDGKPLTLAAVALNSLLSPHADDTSISAQDKVDRFKLALKIGATNNSADDADRREFSIEDVAELKKLIGRTYAPLVVGRAFELLDPQKGNQ